GLGRSLTKPFRNKGLGFKIQGIKKKDGRFPDTWEPVLTEIGDTKISHERFFSHSEKDEALHTIVTILVLNGFRRKDGFSDQFN
ncbi:MAG: hypothetical protein KC964_08015, partial [Candidatus Omnitrophica bacterium]|nr:hypothetical protein [Candidatus Omnitrophota bacterium]